MTSPATTWMRVYKFNGDNRRLTRCKQVACESGITIGKLAETLEGRNFNYADCENGKLAGMATVGCPYSCTCSLFEDQEACKEAANIA